MCIAALVGVLFEGECTVASDTASFFVLSTPGFNPFSFIEWPGVGMPLSVVFTTEGNAGGVFITHGPPEITEGLYINVQNNADVFDSILHSKISEFNGPVVIEGAIPSPVVSQTAFTDSLVLSPLNYPTYTLSLNVDAELMPGYAFRDSGVVRTIVSDGYDYTFSIIANPDRLTGYQPVFSHFQLTGSFSGHFTPEPPSLVWSTIGLACTCLLIRSYRRRSICLRSLS